MTAARQLAARHAARLLWRRAARQGPVLGEDRGDWVAGELVAVTLWVPITRSPDSAGGRWARREHRAD